MDPELRVTMVKRSREIAEELNWEVVVKKYQTYLEIFK